MQKEQVKGWRFWIDRGGTFTDIVACRPDKKLLVHKLLSQNDMHYSDPALQGMRDILGIPKDMPLYDQPIDQVRMGTTVATNALLERKGERVLLAITRGFKDALKIAYQNRSELFAREIKRAEMLYQDVFELEERLDYKGNVIVPLDEKLIYDGLYKHYSNGIRTIAIVCMHSYLWPEHEQRISAIARQIGFTQISASHETIALIKLIGRGDTAVVDAYISPVLLRYVERITKELQGIDLQFMQSSGGLVDAKFFAGKDSILSGPAGGLIGAVETARAAGQKQLITFDMGGTSTDVALYDNALERDFDTMIDQVRVRAPMLKIHTVAAGGGSICKFAQGRYQVGPESAGADPGPACYRRGGPLSVTDCNVMLGKLKPERFPKIFGKDQNELLDKKIVHQKFEALTQEINDQTGTQKTPQQVAEGFLEVAIENMARAIKRVSVARGCDATDFCLVCFGGAAGQHACLVADALGMSKILLHPYAGVLSAYGIGLAGVRTLQQQSFESVLNSSNLKLLNNILRKLAKVAFGELENQKIYQCDKSFIFKQINKVYIRYQGSDNALEVEAGTLSAMQERFEQLHQLRFGYIMKERQLIAATLSVEISASDQINNQVSNGTDEHLSSKLSSDEMLEEAEICRVWMDGTLHDCAFYARDHLLVDDVIKGPAIIGDLTSTTILEPGWQASVLDHGELFLERYEAKNFKQIVDTGCDPVLLEIFNNLFMSIAEQMGFTLQNTAHSVNIKERLDFSCAVFDEHGNLVANAPHMPVHLGSMSDSVRTVLQANNTLQPGDVYALNTPWRGGTHLPDITVVTPIFDHEGKKILFFVASRGHHSDIGGITPGSMPSFSTHIDHEGVLIDNFLLVRNGKFLEKELRNLLTSGQFCVRNYDQNVADLQAQIAANKKGSQELLRMVSRYRLDVVRAYMKHVQDNAEAAVRVAISQLEGGRYTYALDNGAQVSVCIEINKQDGSAKVDFSGTSKQQNNNFNAPSSVCRAAVLYVFRCLVDEPIPMNEGCLRPIELIIPEQSMLSPRYPAAVVAGNVETSQVITDCLFAALKVMAASQGTMNNVTFGNEHVQYYETICGGSGAGPGFAGCDGVHTHMTNSRLTDPEILEQRLPVILERFEILKDTGGKGRWQGGSGVWRKLQFTQKVELSLLANRFKVAPYGMNGGDNGQCGKAHVIRKNGKVIIMQSSDNATLYPGDCFELRTASGGGYGRFDSNIEP